MTSLISDDRLQVLIATAKEVSILPGHYAELGVFTGGSAKVIANAAPAKRLYLYDNFAGGIPEDDTRGVHKKGDFACDVEIVKQNLRGLNVAFRPGIFPDTAVDCRYALVHVDCDTYQSCKAAIEYFWPRLTVGGMMVFDDYGTSACKGIRWAISTLLPLQRVERTVPMQARVKKTVGNS